MSAFGDLTVGERIRLNARLHDWLIEEKGDDTAILEDHFCEYGEHRVGLRFDDGSYREISEDEIIPIEDPYEYAVQVWDARDYVWITTDKQNEHLFQGYWGTKEERKDKLGYLKRVYANATFKLIKRRKAGPVEDA